MLHSILERFMRWSYRKSPVSTIRPHITCFTFDGVIRIAQEYAKHYRDKYKPDKLYGIINRIYPPAKAVSMFGDCDDFASAMVAYGARFNPYLLTYFTINPKQAHTVPVFYYEGEYHLIDWSYHYRANTIEALIARQERRIGNKILSVHYAKFNYAKGQYEPVNKIT